MPELPEVETVVRTLRPGLVGRRITRVRLDRADVLSPAGTDLAAHLLGRHVRAVDRRGKRIVLTLDDGNRLYVHLGMNGQLTLEPPAAPVRPHTHLTVDVEEAIQLRFRDPRRFGGIWWLGQTGDANANMGPEPLTLRTTQFAKRLAKTRRPIKPALLDQALVAGLGNIYVDESLFASAIHPLTPANVLSPEQVARLSRAIKGVLRRAIKHRGSTLRDYMDAEGKQGGFQSRHKVYDRFGQPCRACKTPIDRIVLGGRSTHFCPRCQKRGA